MGMSVSEAAKVYVTEKREISVRQAQLETARDILFNWFRKHPERRDYRKVIGYSMGSRTILDNAAVKAKLGKDLARYQKTVAFEQLTLLQ